MQLGHNKKGNVAQSTAVIVSLIVGVGVSILILIFIGTLGGSTWNLVENKTLSLGNTSVVNESFTAVNNTAVTLKGYPIHSTPAVLIFNVTGGNLVPTSNFTIDYTIGTLTLKTNSNITYNNSPMYITYEYGDMQIQNNIRGGIQSGFAGLEQTGTYLPIIVLAIVIALILGLVMTYAGGKLGMGGSGGSAL